MTERLRSARVILGRPGLSGGFVTNPEMTAAIAGLAPSNASYVTLKSEAGLSAESNLGALTDGLLYNDVTAGVASLRPAVGSDLPPHNHTFNYTLPFTIDGGGVVITTGLKGYIRAPYAGTLKRWELAAEGVSGAIEVDLWKDTAANYPPVVGDVITGGAGNRPRIAATGLWNAGTTFTSWTTTAVAAGDYIAVNVASVTSLTKVTLYLDIERTV